MSEFSTLAPHETPDDNELDARTSELKNQMIQLVDEIIDHPENFELQPEDSEVPQYSGDGVHDLRRAYTRDGVFIEVQRTVEPNEEAFNPDAAVVVHSLLVDLPGARAYVSNNSRFKRLAKAELKSSDMSDANVDKLDDIQGVEDIIAGITLARDSALKMS